MTKQDVEITQEMINLYDEYTHITLDRRSFMDKMTALVGSTTAAVAVTSLIESDTAAAQIVAETDSRIKAETVKFPGEGGDMAGYMVRPANATGKLPGIIVIHENRGLTGHIKDVTRRAALEGYQALGLDLLWQAGGTPTDEDKGREMISKLDRPRTVANAVAAVRWLAAQPGTNGKVGAMGFCWGGAMVNMLAVQAGADLKAAVPYYGAQPSAEQAAKIKAEMLLHYASNDDNINKGIEAYKAALDKAGVKYQAFQYENTQHAFNNDAAAARYNKEAAELAWKRTFELFKRTLA